MSADRRFADAPHPVPPGNLGRPPTLDDVARCYRLFLERDVENATIAVSQIADAPTLWDLIRRFLDSEEALRRRVHRASAHIAERYDPATVVIQASEAQRDALLARTLARWERHGRGMAYDHLFRDPRLFDDRSGKWNREARFGIGHEELERLLLAARRNGIVFAPGMSVLALGCEVASLAAAVTQRLGHFTGIEVGSAALDDGRAALAAHGVPDAELVPLRTFLDSPPAGQRWDLFHSAMLLQHAPPPVSLALLDRCLGRIEPGGYAYFQLPCHIYDYRYDTDDYLRTPSETDASGEIHPLPQAQVLALLARHGFMPIEILPEQRLGPMGLSFTFLARRVSSEELHA